MQSCHLTVASRVSHLIFSLSIQELRNIKSELMAALFSDNIFKPFYLVL